ncbi:MAG: FAD-dependent oxidoreductase [Comamonadaceae bacterium]|nr:FAD-dependent oxidoreductase [Comamonadaceae bacterium]
MTLIEKHRMGGDCLNTGCVPSKALIRSAKLLSHIQRAAGVRHPQGRGRLRLRRGDGARAAGDQGQSSRTIRSSATPAWAWTCVEGTASITSPWTVEVTTADGARRRLTTRSIVIAAGARPFVPPIPGIERGRLPDLRQRLEAARTAEAAGGAGRRADRLAS